MNKFKRFVALALVLCMVMAFVPAFASAAETSYAYNVVHVDAGRKYFSPDSLKTIIDNAADAGFNQVQLYLSDNQGFRFALNDMTLTTEYGAYDLTPALGDGYSDGSKYPDGTNKYLTEDEMTDIIAYANGKGIDIVPCINVPGHMGAILEVFPGFKYSGSNSSIDLANNEAVAFALALTEKYAAYFAEQGCGFYCVGADEYANDLSTMGFEGMGSALYTKFVQFLNDAAEIVMGLDMTPRAFNDGFYYKDYNVSVEPDKAYEVYYWSSGWSGYDVAAASTIAAKGHKMINTNGDYYWVLGNSSWQCSTSKAAQFDETAFSGSTVSEPAGSMFCIWCDNAAAGSEDSVVSGTADVIAAFGAALPDVESLVAAEPKEETPVESEPVDSAVPAELEERTITVGLGGSATDTITGGEYTADKTELDEGVATVTVATTPAQEATVKYTAVSGLTCSDLISSNATKQATSYYHLVNGSYYPVYATRTSSGSNWNTTYTYTWYYSADNGATYTQIGDTQTGNSGWNSSDPTLNFTAYEKSGTEATEASTTVTFRGVSLGTTYVTVGNVRYTINVVAEDLENAADLEISFWITNRKVTANGATSMTLSAADAYKEEGLHVSALIPASGTAESKEMTFWKATRHPSGSHQGDGTDDMTLSEVRTDFNYIRYFGGSWAYSVDGKTWINIAGGDQIVAYYLQVTEVTTEISTNVVDWGESYADWVALNNGSHWFWDGYVENGSKFVFLDFAVIYEDNTQNPASFPVDNTWFYHFDGCSASNPRVLGAINFVENEDYEIWKITVTDGTCTGYSAASTFTPSYDDSTETTVWDENMGGEPCVESLSYTANRSGKLIRVYIRAKVTPDALTVHYLDRSANDIEFYNYNIAVDANKGTLFNEAFGMGSEKNTLVNNSVLNIRNVTQYVSADLATMPEIKAYYRYCNYTLVDTERSADGKHVYLYYTFTPVVSFVADFGLSLEIEPTDLNQEGYTTDGADIKAVKVIGTYDTEAGSTASSEYGSLSVNGTTVTYTPTSVLQGVDFFTIFVATALDDASTEENEEAGIAYRVYVFPATTVYYEESFATLDGFTVTGSANAGLQETEKAGEKSVNYGFTAGYTAAGMTNGTEAVSTAAGSTAEITFKGTGIELYANSTTATGTVAVLLYDANGAIKKLYQVDTVAMSGDTGVTAGQDADSYSLPIVSIEGLDYGTYRIKLQHVGAGDQLGDIRFDGFRVHNTLNALDSTAYAESERNPSFLELRDSLLSAQTITLDKIDDEQHLINDIVSQVYANANTLDGALVLSGNKSYDVADLLNNGPKNEIFLRSGESLSFSLGTAKAQIGLKAVNGSVSYTVNGTAGTIATSVDMFYGEYTGYVTIVNNGDGILSVTKLKMFSTTGTAALEPIDEELVIHALQTMGVIEKPVNPFADVSEDSWYYDSVMWAVGNGITNGADAAHFLPEAQCQRAAVVTFMWRAAGSPEPVNAVNPFLDVPEDAFFCKAVLWAVENGITNGMDESHFAPFAACSRAQVVTFLWRAKGCPAAETVNPFVDVAEGQWYTEAVLWAVENGVTNGMSGTIFGVESICNRAQIVTFLYRAK